MIRVTRMVWSGALVVGLGMVVMGCSGTAEKPPTVPKSQQEKAVGEMKERQSGAPAPKTEKAAEKGAVEKGEKKATEKASKTEKKGAD